MSNLGNAFHIRTYLYIAGILTPHISATITLAFNALPLLSVSVPPYAELFGIGRRDRIPVQLYMRDSLTGSNTMYLVFEGEITSFGYVSNAVGREVVLNARHNMSYLRDANMSFMRSIMDIAINTMTGGAQANIETTQPILTFPASLFMQGINPVNTGKLITKPVEYLENTYDFLLKAATAKAAGDKVARGTSGDEVEIPAYEKHNDSLVAGFYGDLSRSLRLQDRYAPLPFFDGDDGEEPVWFYKYDSPEDAPEPDVDKDKEAYTFPLIKGMQKEAALNQLTGMTDSGVQTQSVYDMMNYLVGSMMFEYAIMPAPTVHVGGLTASAAEASAEEGAADGSDTATDGSSEARTPELGVADQPEATAEKPLVFSSAKDSEGHTVTTVSATGETTLAGQKVNANTNPEVVTALYQQDQLNRMPITDSAKEADAQAQLSGAAIKAGAAEAALEGRTPDTSASAIKLDEDFEGEDSWISKLGLGEMKMVNTFIKPIFAEAVPPACNLMFRSTLQGLSAQEFVYGVPTRVRTTDMANVFARKFQQNSLLAKYGMVDYYPTKFYPDVNSGAEGAEYKEIQDIPVEDTPDQGGRKELFNSELLPHEEFTGPWLYDCSAPAWLSYMKTPPADATEEDLKKYENDVRQYKNKVLKALYYLRVNSLRSMSVTCALNPFIVPGFPGVVYDAIDSGFVFVGYVQSVAHSFSKTNVSTSVELGFVRVLDECLDEETRLQNVFEVLSRKVTTKKPKMSKVYKRILGCGALSFDDCETLSEHPAQNDPIQAYQFNKRTLMTMEQYNKFMGLSTLEKRVVDGDEVPSVLGGEYVEKRYVDKTLENLHKKRDPRLNIGVVTDIKEGKVKVPQAGYTGGKTVVVTGTRGSVTLVAEGEVAGAAEAYQSAGADFANMGLGNSREAADLRKSAEVTKGYVEVIDLEKCKDKIKVGKIMPKLDTIGAVTTVDSANLSAAETEYAAANTRYEAVIESSKKSDAEYREKSRAYWSTPEEERTEDMRAELDAARERATSEQKQVLEARSEYDSAYSKYSGVAAEGAAHIVQVDYSGVRKILKYLADREFAQVIYSTKS